MLDETLYRSVTRLVKIYLNYLIMQSSVRLWRFRGSNIAKPNFKCVKIFREDLIGIHMGKPVLVMNRPIQVGFAIVDLSKYPM